MPTLVSTLTQYERPWICVDSNGDVWTLITTYSGARQFQISKNGTLKTTVAGTDIHGASVLDLSCMCIDDSDVLHVFCSPTSGGQTRDIAYRAYDTGTETWQGSWVEVASYKTAYTMSLISCAIDYNGALYVTYSYNPKNGQAFFSTNESASWVEYELGAVPKSYAYLNAGIGKDSTGDIWFWYKDFHGGTPNYWAYRIWDVSGSSLGSESEFSETEGCTAYQTFATYDGSTMWYFMMPVSSSSTEDWIWELDDTPSKADLSGFSTDRYYFDYSTSGNSMAFIYVDGKLKCLTANYGFDGIKCYIKSGSSWSFDSTLRENAAGDQASFLNVAHHVNHQSANFGDNVYYIWTEYISGTYYTYYDILYPGTLVKDSNAAYLWGGLHPYDNQPAYLLGDPSRGHVHAFIQAAYDVGGNTRDAIHAFASAKASYVTAFCAGQQNMYYDVVDFTAYGSTGTQDIYSSNLGGNTPFLVFFGGAQVTSWDTNDTSGMGYYQGLTDGTYEIKAYCYQSSGGGSSSATSGAVTNSACVGVGYNSGGSASFDSWYSSGGNTGVTLNWTAAAATSYKNFALMMACDSPGTITSAQGTFAPDNADTDDTVVIDGLGFMPDFIIFFTPQGGCGIGVGIAQRENAPLTFKQAMHNNDLYSGYYNWPGNCGRSDYYSDRVIADGVNSPSGVGIWGVQSFDEDGFTMVCEAGDGAYDGPDARWYAIKINGATFKMEFDQTAFNGGAGSFKWSSAIRPKAHLSFHGGWYTCQYSFSSYNHGIGASSNLPTLVQYGASGSMGSYGGSEWDMYMMASNTCLQLPGAAAAYVDSYASDGLNMYQGGSGNNGALVLFFGYGVDAIPSRKHAYMFAHSQHQYAYAHGKDYGQSSQSAFFYVVDAQDQKPCYMQGLDPSRTSKPAYTGGYDDPCILFHEFQLTNASGNQDITTPLLNGVTPKACVIWLFGVDSLTVTNDGESLFSIGMSDGTTSYSWGARAHNDLYAYFDACDGVTQEGSVICIVNGSEASPAISAKASVSFITDGMRLNFNNAPGGVWCGVVQFFAGTEVSVLCGATTPATGDVNVTSPGFEPDLIFAMEPNQPIDTDTAASTNFWGTYWGWAVNDEHSPRPSQITTGFRSYRGASGPDGIEPGTWRSGYIAQDIPGFTYPDNYLFNQFDDVYVKSFDASGFTLNFESQTWSNLDLCWLVVKWGKSKKADIFIDWSNFEEDVDAEFSRKPAGNWNIVPESAFIVHSHLMAPNALGFVGGNLMGPNYTYLGNINRNYITTSSGIYWDSYSQFYDQISRSRTGGSNNLHYLHVSRDVDREFKDGFVTGNWRFATRNGLILNYNHIDWDAIATLPPEQGWNPPVGHFIFVIGTAELYASTPAYMKGQKENWPGRTPRGCYTEGTTPGVEDNIPAFIDGKEPAVGSSDAYTHGQVDVTDSHKSFLKGMDTDIDNAPAYLAGGINTSSSKSAWCRSGWDIEDSQSAFLSGAASRSSTEAFAEGFSATPTSSISAFTGGGGPWPFTDDFTGSNEDPWNTSKWISTEEL